MALKKPSENHLTALEKRFHVAVIKSLPKLTREEMQQWIGLCRPRLSATLGPLKSTPLTVRHTGSISIDYSVSAQEMMARGRYVRAPEHLFESSIESRWTTKKITHFEGVGVERFSTALLAFSSKVYCDAIVPWVVAIDHRRAWKVAGLEHLLAYGVRPLWGRKPRSLPIVALGARIHQGLPISGHESAYALYEQDERGNRVLTDDFYLGSPESITGHQCLVLIVRPLPVK
jgi:hypothetical protein